MTVHPSQATSGILLPALPEGAKLRVAKSAPFTSGHRGPPPLHQIYVGWVREVRMAPRLWAVAGLALTALLAVACGGPIEVPAAPAPTATANGALDATATPTEELPAPTTNEYPGLGTSSDLRHAIEVGGEIYSLIPVDGIRPIYDPTFIPGSSADLPAEEFVIGVSLNGDSRAYPVSTLRSREMVNDVVGGVPILATW